MEIEQNEDEKSVATENEHSQSTYIFLLKYDFVK